VVCMARPIKRTVDYFPHDANSSSRKTLTIIENHFGLEGYAVWFKLLETISVSNNHIIDIRNTTDLDYLSGKMRIKPGRLVEILDKLAELKAIDVELWQHKIIWCQNFVDRLSYLYERRRDPTPQRPILDHNNDIVNNNPITPAITKLLPHHKTETVQNDKKQGGKTPEKPTKIKQGQSPTLDHNNDIVNNNPITPAITKLSTHSNTQSKLNKIKLKKERKKEAPENPISINQETNAVAEYYMKFIGDIKGNTASWLIDLEEEYSSEWVLEALRVVNIKGIPTQNEINNILKQSHAVNLSPEMLHAKGNGKTPKERESHIIEIINGVEKIIGCEFMNTHEAYQCVVKGLGKGFVADDFYGCTNGLMAEKFWQSNLCKMAPILERLPKYKAGKLQSDTQIAHPEKRYSVEDYLPKEEKPTE